MDTYDIEEMAVELAHLKEYKRINLKVIAFQKEIMQMLPEEGKKLFLQYDEATANLCDFENKFYFEKGIKILNEDAISKENII